MARGGAVGGSMGGSMGGTARDATRGGGGSVVGGTSIGGQFGRGNVQPVAARLHRPSWRDPRLVVGLLLIATAVAGVALTLRQADTTQPVYAAAQTLTPGTALDQSNVTVVHVRVGEGYIGGAQDIWGEVVTRTVGAGELLPAAAVAPADAAQGRPVAVSVTTPLAAGIVPGAAVDVWVTPAEGSSRLVGEGLIVADVAQEESALGSAGSTVYVVVPAADVGALLDALAVDGSITVVGMT